MRISPFHFFGGAWLIVGCAYLLRWSGLYPALSASVVVFISVLIVMSILGALVIGVERTNNASGCISTRSAVVAIGYYLVAFAYNGGIPTLMTLSRVEYDIYGFGLPFIHVPMLAWSSFLVIFGFNNLIKLKTAQAGLVPIIILVCIIGIGSRSALISIAIAIIFLFVRNWKGKITSLLIGGLFIALVGSAFGVYGNLRLDNQIRSDVSGPVRNSSTAVLKLGRATREYQETGFGTVGMWLYLYSTNSLATFQSIISKSTRSEVIPDRGVIAVLREMTPDIVGANLADALQVKATPTMRYQMRKDLTTVTAFGGIYLLYGWPGAYGFLLAIVVLVAMCLNYAGNRHTGNPFYEPTLAVLAAFLTLTIFGNMWAYSPVSLQIFIALVYCAIFNTRRYLGAKPIMFG